MTASDRPVEAAPIQVIFELDRLVAYDDQAVLDEMHRAIGLMSDPVITRAAFDRVARVSSSTCLRRFGGWRQALSAVGAASRYGGPVVTQKMADQHGRGLDDVEVTRELKRVADALGKTTLTRQELRQHSQVLGERIVINRFGSWQAALAAAGLSTVPLGRRWTDEDYFTNLLNVWTHHGRAPRYAELNQPPSRISNGSYAKKFGSWGAAKLAFLERVSSDLHEPQPAAIPASVSSPRTPAPPAAEQRTVRLGLRYTVLRRDHFRCSNCGRSPATHLGCVLHVDHIHAFARGGKTTLENLKTLCDDCNLGKGSTVETDAQRLAKLQQGSNPEPPEVEVNGADWARGSSGAQRSGGGTPA